MRWRGGGVGGGDLGCSWLFCDEDPMGQDVLFPLTGMFGTGSAAEIVD